MVDPKPRAFHRTLRPGISIGSVGCGGTGTLGLVVQTPRRELVMLSAWHVLVGSVCGGGGRPWVLQPGRADGANDPRLVVAKVLKHVRGSGLGEAAIAKIVRRPVSTRLVGESIHFAGTRAPILGERLELTGRASRTTAIVKKVGPMQTRFSKGPFQGVWLEPPAGSPSKLTGRGDSGAAWYSPADQMAVAMHLEGERPGEAPYAKAMELKPLIHHWNLRFVKRV